MKKKRTQFIKGFNGNDLLTPAPSWAAHSITAVLQRWVMKGGAHRGKQLCTLHTSLNPNPITPVLFHQLLALVCCQNPEYIPSPLGIWVLGLRALRAEEGCGDPLQRTLLGDTTRAKPSWGFLLATLLNLVSGGQDKREGICPFLGAAKTYQSIQHLQKEECKSHSTKIIYL